MSRTPPRAGIAAAAWLATGLTLCGLGGWRVSAPHAMGGPMNFDLSNPLGAALLCVGAVALLRLPPGWRRTGWVLAATLSAWPVLLHLWRYPPFLDGQTFAHHLGVPYPDVGPATGGFTAFGLFPAILALAARWPGAGPRPASEPDAAMLGWTLPVIALTGLLFEGFNGAWWRFAAVSTARAAVLVGCAGMVLLAACRPRHPAARVAGAGGMVLSGLCVAMLWLEGQG